MSRICLDCRAVLEAGEACLPGHVPAANRGLIATSGLRRGERALTRLEAAVVTVVVFLGAWWFAVVTLGAVLPGLTPPWATTALVTLAAFVLTAEIGRRWLWQRWLRRRVRAIDVPRRDGPRVVGRVEVAHPLTAPLSGRACAAWRYVLEGDDRIVAQDGRCAALTVRLPDGTPVLVPAGRARVIAGRADGDLARARATLDGAIPGDEPIRIDAAVEAVILPGDQVELLGALEPAPAPAPTPHGYRDAPPTILRPVGVVQLRRIEA